MDWQFFQASGAGTKQQNPQIPDLVTPAVAGARAYSDAWRNIMDSALRGYTLSQEKEERAQTLALRKEERAEDREERRAEREERREEKRKEEEKNKQALDAIGDIASDTEAWDVVEKRPSDYTLQAQFELEVPGQGRQRYTEYLISIGMTPELAAHTVSQENQTVSYRVAKGATLERIEDAEARARAIGLTEQQIQGASDSWAHNSFSSTGELEEYLKKGAQASGAKGLLDIASQARAEAVARESAADLVSERQSERKQKEWMREQPLRAAQFQESQEQTMALQRLNRSESLKNAASDNKAASKYASMAEQLVLRLADKGRFSVYTSGPNSAGYLAQIKALRGEQTSDSPWAPALDAALEGSSGVQYVEAEQRTAMIEQLMATTFPTEGGDMSINREQAEKLVDSSLLAQGIEPSYGQAEQARAVQLTSLFKEAEGYTRQKAQIDATYSGGQMSDPLLPPTTNEAVAEKTRSILENPQSRDEALTNAERELPAGELFSNLGLDWDSYRAAEGAGAKKHPVSPQLRNGRVVLSTPVQDPSFRETLKEIENTSQQELQRYFHARMLGETSISMGVTTQTSAFLGAVSASSGRVPTALRSPGSPEQSLVAPNSGNLGESSIIGTAAEIDDFLNQ
jgi:hypothetical protein